MQQPPYLALPWQSMVYSTCKRIPRVLARASPPLTWDLLYSAASKWQPAFDAQRPSASTSHLAFTIPSSRAQTRRRIASTMTLSISKPLPHAIGNVVMFKGLWPKNAAI